jgi:hypothetical protein
MLVFYSEQINKTEIINNKYLFEFGYEAVLSNKKSFQDRCIL